MKKLLSLLLSGVTIFTLVVPVFAANNGYENISETDEDFGMLIDEITYYDEELDATIIERTYFAPSTTENSVVPYNDSKGSGTFTQEKQHVWNGSHNITTIYARGFFSWANGDVSVSLPEGNYDYFPAEFKNVSKNITSGTGRYAFIFNKYAYVTCTVTYTNSIGNGQELSVTVRVSESGNKI